MLMSLRKTLFFPLPCSPTILHRLFSRCIARTKHGMRDCFKYATFINVETLAGQFFMLIILAEAKAIPYEVTKTIL